MGVILKVIMTLIALSLFAEAVGELHYEYESKLKNWAGVVFYSLAAIVVTAFGICVWCADI